MTELIPCPFCGSQALQLVAYVYCQECQTCGPQADTTEKAAEAWNTRTFKTVSSDISASKKEDKPGD